MPPVAAADKRGYLMPGENALPWVQGLTLALARCNYYFQLPGGPPFAIGLATLIALSLYSYTAMTAVRLSQGASGKRQIAFLWLGLFVPTLLRWLFSLEAAGTWFVAVTVLNSSSLWAGIPEGVRKRDGRFFCDFTMVLFNAVSSAVWLLYAILLDDPYTIAMVLVGLFFTIPCLLLKFFLNPACLGVKPQQSSNAGDAGASAAPSPFASPLLTISTPSGPLDGMDGFELGPQQHKTIDSNEHGETSTTSSSDFGSLPLPLSIRQRSSSQRPLPPDTVEDSGVSTSTVTAAGTGNHDTAGMGGNNDVGGSTDHDSGAFESPAAALGTISSMLGSAVTNAIIDTFGDSFSATNLSASAGFGAPDAPFVRSSSASHPSNYEVDVESGFSSAFEPNLDYTEPSTNDSPESAMHSERPIPLSFSEDEMSSDSMNDSMLQSVSFPSKSFQNVPLLEPPPPSPFTRGVSGDTNIATEGTVFGLEGSSFARQPPATLSDAFPREPSPYISRRFAEPDLKLEEERASGQQDENAGTIQPFDPRYPDFSSSSVENFGTGSAPSARELTPAPFGSHIYASDGSFPMAEDGASGHAKGASESLLTPQGEDFSQVPSFTHFPHFEQSDPENSVTELLPRDPERRDLPSDFFQPPP